jgi:hypothetical protein
MAELYGGERLHLNVKCHVRFNGARTEQHYMLLLCHTDCIKTQHGCTENDCILNSDCGVGMTEWTRSTARSGTRARFTWKKLSVRVTLKAREKLIILITF